MTERQAVCAGSSEIGIIMGVNRLFSLLNSVDAFWQSVQQKHVNLCRSALIRRCDGSNYLTDDKDNFKDNLNFIFAILRDCAVLNATKNESAVISKDLKMTGNFTRYVPKYISFSINGKTYNIPITNLYSLKLVEEIFVTTDTKKLEKLKKKLYKHVFKQHAPTKAERIEQEKQLQNEIVEGLKHEYKFSK